ncbi:hypothetical protein COT04_01690 [Candidatus Shapirobacteria bacterium CG07_land_8_20_14_0_80_39_12]|uniref:Peptidase A2 domain-containing protein n=2 Tax=Candidatus Shapironibacteriota TaxID=1752721 RepID=A0A2M6YPT0_9BACT|nr:MAG: hypothetical protein COT04_01690 [Candidatus Shapirobacteria bacterium CG07_land_8_20_14_0_80_39_12]PJA49885.1 MAG: hypothetical protein CO169_00665 [Candidatus Shapirobacteria bacterium CG_4_9_14_3_um_filter_39_13]
MNKSAIYNYKNSDGRPYIPIWLCYKHQFFKTKIDCLLDSGSDTNLFPAAWGKAVKIDITKGKEKWISRNSSFRKTWIF